MTRVSTIQNYNIMTSNLMKAQINQNSVGQQVSSQKVADDLKGYSKDAEMLTAMRGTQTRISGLIDQNKQITNKLATQDSGIGKVADSTKSARDAVANALAAGNATTLMQQLQASFGDVVQGLNTKSNGLYVFSGAKTDTQTTSATTMADLTAWLKTLGSDADKLNVIFISVDPERDTPQQLKTYLSNFDPHIRGYTGTPEAIAKTAKEYRVYYQKVPQDGGGYTIDHSSAIYLFDAKGAFVSPIGYHTPADRAVSQLRDLIKG